ncbi:MAG: cytochrome c oxidase subunit 3 family protein [Acidobacteria bacterium]|nr:cytochrome c oxidase subunit 3 family protein [Acidobacteriota bacterium]
MEQQREAASLGMWVFLVTEILFFGGLFLAYTIARYQHPAAFAEASLHLDVALGGVNTAVLIVSSLTMALAVHAAQTGRRKGLLGFLALTAALGCVFLLIKGVEYADKFEHHLVPGDTFSFAGPEAGSAELFFSLYFAMTGLHALHMVIGVAVLAVLLAYAWRGSYSVYYHTPVEVAGLYWHFVDIIWIFLFPLLYLIDIQP